MVRVMVSLPPLPALPTISVYCTAYNHERFVAEALESVLAQDWPADRLQVVVIDDGSTDGTLDALQPYRDVVRVIHQENRGVRGAVNRGMEELTGDLITSISGDDVWVPGRLRRLAEVLQEHPRAGLVHSDLEVIDADGRVIAPSFRRATGIADRTAPLRDQLLSNNVVCGAGVMQRGCLKHLVHPIPDEAPWEDHWWAWRLGRAAATVYLDEVTCRYRMHGSNMSLGASPEQVSAAAYSERALRREMLRGLRPGEAGAEGAVLGLRAFRRSCAAGDGAGIAPGDDAALPVGDADRARSRERAELARRAVATGDVGAAVVHAVAGVAEDPTHAALDDWLEALVRDWGDGLPVEHELRHLVVLADADELRRDPALLGAYVAEVGADDDLTLVIHGAGWSDRRLVEAFGPALEHSDADVLATGDEPLDRAALQARAHAALGREASGGVLPVHGARDVRRLRDGAMLEVQERTVGRAAEVRAADVHVAATHVDNGDGSGQDPTPGPRIPLRAADSPTPAAVR
jgi:cellulose synthase/poly-beta-1,6-N-acetylglucosamine synthase-like glycosyltransferase